MTSLNLFILTGLWLSYFFIHSLLASLSVKNWFKFKYPTAAHGYRLLYNFFAIVLLFPLIFYIYFVPSQVIIEWSGTTEITANIIALAGFAGFLYSLKFYAGMEFLGLSQYKAKKTDEAGSFVISPLHRYVRHPWYLFALMIIWTRDMNAHFLLSACLMTAYFYIGSYFEEQKLIVHFGERFKQYTKKVPRIIPSPRRFLTSSQASKLTRED